MDRQLAERLNALSAQNDALGKARNAYLLKEAERKHFESVLIQCASGKSHAEKQVNAQASKDWLKFHKELAQLESEFEFQKLKYEILDKAYLAEHATYKLEDRLIKRGAS